MRFDLVLVGLTMSIGIIAMIIFILTFVNRRRFHGYWGVPLLFFLNMIYAFGYAFELASEPLLLKIVFNHVQNIAIPFLAVTWLFIAKRSTNLRIKFSWKKDIWYLVIPILLFVTSQLHYFTDLNWYYNEVKLIEIQGLFDYEMRVMILGKSFLHYIGQAYSLIIIGFVAYLYINRALKVKGIQKSQAFGMAICSVLASVLVIPAFFTSETSNIDLTLYYLSVIGYLILYTMYHYEFLILKPLANKSLFSDANSPILIFDDKFDLVDWNTKVDLFDFVVPEYQKSVDQVIVYPELVLAIKKTVPFSFDYKNMHFVVESLDLKRKASSVGYVVHFLEMSIFADRLNKLDYLATHDSLTNTLNRTAFYEKINQYFDRIDNINETYAIIIFDFDDFKSINDQYGHLAGDFVLTETLKKVSDSLPKDSLICRFGGEEFLIFIQDILLSNVIDYAENLRLLIENLIMNYKEYTINVQVSIGLCSSSKAIDYNIESLIEKADRALYQSKRTGKNKVSLFQESMTK